MEMNSAGFVGFYFGIKRWW